ncbi:Syncephapepsin [Yarrowia sp. B02]|nr:Syncephapepsin [Yarrowia sp. B02]
MKLSLLLASLATAGIVHLPLTEREYTPEQHSARLASRGIVHATQTKNSRFYEAELEVGTPPQKIKGCFDTGSGLLWLQGVNTTNCLQHKHCDTAFNASASSSWRFTGEHSGWGSKGNNGNETISYGGFEVKDFQTWVATDNFEWDMTIFGQAAVDNPKSNFVKALADAGKISRPVYSLNAEHPVNWKDRGIVNNVYYGGFDRAKYQGELTTLNVTRHGTYTMPLGGFSTGGEAIKLTREHLVVLDTGTEVVFLPNSTLRAISEKFGGNGEFENHLYKVACDSNPELTYHWGYTNISMDLSKFVDRSSHDGKCVLQGLYAQKDSDQILLTGHDFISRALVIYDNEWDSITIGQAKYTDESDVVEITGNIPGALLYSDWLAGKPAPKSASQSVQSTLAVKPVQTSDVQTSEGEGTSDSEWCQELGTC